MIFEYFVSICYNNNSTKIVKFFTWEGANNFKNAISKYKFELDICDIGEVERI